MATTTPAKKPGLKIVVKASFIKTDSIAKACFADDRTFAVERRRPRDIGATEVVAYRHL